MQKETVLFHFETLYFEIETYNSQNQEVQLENDFGKETTLLSLFNFRLTKTTFQQLRILKFWGDFCSVFRIFTFEFGFNVCCFDGTGQVAA